MTKELEWKLAKWLKHHGETKRKDLPSWVDPKILRSEFFCVECERDSDGYPIIGPENVFLMGDKHLDAYQLERQRRVRAFRDWLEPVGVVVSIIISIISLIFSIKASQVSDQKYDRRYQKEIQEYKSERIEYRYDIFKIDNANSRQEFF